VRSSLGVTINRTTGLTRAFRCSCGVAITNEAGIDAGAMAAIFFFCQLEKSEEFWE